MDLALDSLNNVYLTGTTESPDFPVHESFPEGQSLTGSVDVFVTKLNSTGRDIVYSSYLGGSVADFAFAFGIDVDSQGQAYIVGDTYSVDFPLASPEQDTQRNTGLQTSCSGGGNGSGNSTANDPREENAVEMKL